MEVSLLICSVAEPTKAPLSLQSSGIKQLCFVARAQLGSRQEKHVATQLFGLDPIVFYALIIVAIAIVATVAFFIIRGRKPSPTSP
jgi:hypothetical protein